MPQNDGDHLWASEEEKRYFERELDEGIDIDMEDVELDALDFDALATCTDA